jgi:hypothetical protein
MRIKIASVGEPILRDAARPLRPDEVWLDLPLLKAPKEIPPMRYSMVWHHASTAIRSTSGSKKLRQMFPHSA